MNIGFTGSRSITELTTEMKEELNEIIASDTVIHGGAYGADLAVEEYLYREIGCETEIIRPVNSSIKTHYLYRNIEIICKSDKIIAFWDGVSRGTKFVIDYAKARGVPVTIVSL